MTDTLTTFSQLALGSLFYSACDIERTGPIHVKINTDVSMDVAGQTYKHDPQCPVLPASACHQPELSMEAA